MIECLWGLKTAAIFDVWTIEHVLSGLSIGYLVKKENLRHFQKHHPTLELAKKTKTRVDLVAVLFLAYVWETLEHYLEEGLAGQTVALWFQGVEFWPNRFISDPLMLVLGYWLASRYPRAVWPARGLTGAWLVVHIFVFPDSMYLHHVF